MYIPKYCFVPRSLVLEGDSLKRTQFLEEKDSRYQGQLPPWKLDGAKQSILVENSIKDIILHTTKEDLNHNMTKTSQSNVINFKVNPHNNIILNQLLKNQIVNSSKVWNTPGAEVQQNTELVLKTLQHHGLKMVKT